MNGRDVLIKWTGSKRLQAPQILERFPKKINTYYEPFLGGGSILCALLSSDIEVSNFECSDLNPDLIEIWRTVRDDPQSIADFYRENQPKLDKELYRQIRAEHNERPDPRKFFFLLRTCRNGLVRYNRHGKFNSAYHHGRKGAAADTVEKMIFHWHEKIASAKVRFSIRDYREVNTRPGDMLYLDPPYARSVDFRMYYLGHFDFEAFWNWLQGQRSTYFISLNGFKNDQDCRVDVPAELFDEQILISNGLNKFDQMVHNRVVAQDSLYIREV